MKNMVFGVGAFALVIIGFIFISGCIQQGASTGQSILTNQPEPTSNVPSDSTEAIVEPQPKVTDRVPEKPSDVTSFLYAGTVNGTFQYQTKHVYGIKVEEQKIWTLKVSPDIGLDVRLKYLGPNGEDYTQQDMCSFEDAKDNICVSSASNFVDKGGKGTTEILIGGGAVNESPENTYVRYIEIDSKNGKGKYILEFEVKDAIADAGKNTDVPSNPKMGFKLDPGTYNGFLQWSDADDCYQLSLNPGKHSISVEPQEDLDVSINSGNGCLYIYKTENSEDPTHECGLSGDEIDPEEINAGLKGFKEILIWKQEVDDPLNWFCIRNKDTTRRGSYKLQIK